jgi:hypothetical protein
MPISARFPCGRSQDFTFCRRNFLQGLASVVLPSLVLGPQPVAPVSRGRSLPEFSIGDKIRTSWEAETGVFRSENGEVVGVCWHPKKRHWEYLVVWESSSCFDEELTDAEGLELNHHA